MDSEENTLPPMIEKIYDIVVDPGRLEQLCHVWVQHLQGAGGAPNFGVLGDASLLPHVDRVAAALQQMLKPELPDSGPDSEPGVSPAVWVNDIRSAAIIVTPTGEIVAANAAAHTALGVRAGKSISNMPLEADELIVLRAKISRSNGNEKRNAHNGTQLLFRLQLGSRSGPTLVRVIEGAGGNPAHTGLVMTIVSWPQTLSQLLQSAFGLTSAEVEVAKDLTLGLNVRDIAGKSSRSEPTVRSHVRAVLAKTETNSQLELLRLTLGLMDGFQKSSKQLACVATGDPTGNGNVYQTLIVTDRRRCDYLVIGDPHGAPFLLFPSDAGSTRLPASAELDLAKRGLCMVVPIRAGFGWSSQIPAGRHVHDVAIEDTCQLMDHLGIVCAPVLSICEDIRIAVEMACRHPERISAIIGLGAIMPAHTTHHYQRMNALTRFVIINARYAPRTLPYIALAFYNLARRVGPKRFLQITMADSIGDKNCLNDSEICEALIKGSEISMRPDFTAHVAWAAHAVANFTGDWSSRLSDCPAPIILFHGHEDPYSPIETVKEFAHAIKCISLRDHHGCGQLLYPVWSEIADEIEHYVTR